jgi:hypothetical protein
VFPHFSSADEETLGYTHGRGVRVYYLHGSVVPVGVTVLLGLCNLPRRGCGKPAKPGLLYPLVWIPCCGIVFAGIARHSRLHKSDWESWVICYDI